MAGLEIRKVVRWDRRTAVLDGLSLRAPRGRITALLGDDESGRLAALKVVAGIDKHHEGEIFIDDEDVSHARGNARSAATVFRTAALMPHKSAYENIAYPLRLARFDRATIEERVAAVAEHFGLTDLLELRPRKLTAQQAYQIGLARALVRDPAVYLFERPDDDSPKIVDLALTEMRRLRDEFERTVVYATDRGEEARALADWIVVLHKGRKLQMGSPARLVEQPVNRRAARLLGAKLRSAEVTACGETGVVLTLKDGSEVTLPHAVALRDLAGTRATLGIWPEDMREEEGAAVWPPERCYLFDEKGRLAVTPEGEAPDQQRPSRGARRRQRR